MPRTSEFTATEDAIIMATTGEDARHTNELLASEGLRERSPKSIQNRRAYLKRRQAQPEDELDLSDLTRQYRSVEKRLEVLTSELDQLTEEREAVALRIRAATERLLSDG